MPLEEQLRTAAQGRYAEAAAAAPEVELAEAAFVARVLDSIAGESDPHAAIAGLHVEDLFVAHAAVMGDRAAIVVVDRRLRAQVAAVVRSVGESRGFGDDLESELRVHVLGTRDDRPARLASYAGRGPLDGWLRVTATREALRVRKQAASRDGGAEDVLLELPGVASPELEYLKETYREHVRAAFRSAIPKLDDRQQNLIKLYYADGVGVERLGQMYRVHFSTISRWIAAARETLFDATRMAVRERLDIDDAEFAEIMDLVRSRLDVTISLFAREA